MNGLSGVADAIAVAVCTPQPDRNAGIVTMALPAATDPRKSLRLIVMIILWVDPLLDAQGAENVSFLLTP